MPRKLVQGMHDGTEGGVTEKTRVREKALLLIEYGWKREEYEEKSTSAFANCDPSTLLVERSDASTHVRPGQQPKIAPRPDKIPLTLSASCPPVFRHPLSLLRHRCCVSFACYECAVTTTAKLNTVAWRTSDFRFCCSASPLLYL